MKRPAAFVVLLLAWLAGLSSAGLAQEDLLWPTDAGRCVTSSFCEFRPGHFHAGIDFSTGGKTGYRCFAAGDGSIVRARVSCGGYGKAIYVRLADGRTVLYAHLSRFAGAFADSVWEWQRASGSAYFDRSFEPGTFPVARGDVVGFTGQSGVGVPHLHFEVRDEAERPLDPLTAGLRVPDSSPPVIARIALTPLTPASSVDGSSDTIILDVHPIEGESSRGRIPRVIPVEGEIGLGVEVDESIDACRYQLAPRALELWDGNELLYSVDYARMSFAEADLVDFQIDPRFSYASKGSFHQLHRRAGNVLPVIVDAGRAGGVLRGAQIPLEDRALDLATTDASAPPPATVQRLGEKVRRITVIAKDAAGNRGEAVLELSFAPPPTVPVLSADRVTPPREEATFEGAWVDTIEVVGAARAEGRDLEHVELDWSLDSGATWTSVAALTPSPDGAFGTSFTMPERVPGAGRRDPWVRARAVDRLGAAGFARTVALEGSVPVDLPVASYEIETLGGWIELRFREEVAWSVLQGGWSQSGPQASAVLVRPWGRGARVVARPGAATLETIESIAAAWKGYDPWGRRRLVPARLPEPVGQSGAVIELDGGVRVSFGAGAFAEPAYPILRSMPATDGPELRALSLKFAVDSGAVPIARPYEIAFAATGDEPFDHAAIFVQDGDRLRYTSTERRVASWVARTSTPLPFGLYEDRVAPRLGALRFETREGHQLLVFSAADEGAGVDCSAVEVFLDGNPLVHELDDETGEVVAVPESVVPGTEYGFEIRVLDRCGNLAMREGRVRAP